MRGFPINTGYPLTELGFKKIGPFTAGRRDGGIGLSDSRVSASAGSAEFTTFDIQRYKGYTRVSEIMPESSAASRSTIRPIRAADRCKASTWK